MKQFSEVSKWIGVECSDLGNSFWKFEWNGRATLVRTTDPDDIMNAPATILLLKAIEAKGWDWCLRNDKKGYVFVVSSRETKWKIDGREHYEVPVKSFTGSYGSMFLAVLSAATAVCKEIQKNAELEGRK